jgi:hypothetical protein
MGNGLGHRIAWNCRILFLIFQRSHIVRTPKRSRALFVPFLAEEPIPVDNRGMGGSVLNSRTVIVLATLQRLTRSVVMVLSER